MKKPAFAPLSASLALGLGAFLTAGCGGSSDEAAPKASGGDEVAAAGRTADEVPDDVKPAWSGKPDPQVKGGPGQAEADVFHPMNQPDDDGTRPPMPEPRRGGRVFVHLFGMPRHFNYMTENSAESRWILYEVHEYLVQRNWDTWVHEPRLSTDWVTEDTLILKGGRGDDNANIVYGEVSEDGDAYVVKPLSGDNPLEGEKRVAKSDVESLQKETVFTFNLRDDVKWQDGHPFNAHDVYFAWQCYWNQTVDCEDSRYKIQKIVHADVLDDHRIRFFYGEQYFLALDAFTDLTVLPSHLYNLSDPDNPKHDPASDVLGAAQGEFVNDHENNFKWVGLGPYQVKEVTEQWVIAERFEGYFDPERAGYVDAIHWRHIPSVDAGKQALLNGELDYFARISSDDYFGEYCQQEAFTNTHYKGYTYQPRMQYIAWNTRRPVFKEQAVRTALGHAMDWDEFLSTVGNGLGVRITSTQFYMSPTYDHALEPIAFDLEKAEEILTDAGWYDRDGDGIRDKNGIPLEFEYLMTPGNTASQRIVLKLQENCAKIGIKVNVATRDWAAFIERAKTKDFDAFGMAWVLPVESDPQQLWHSSEGKSRGSNYPGLDDPEIDRLIEAIQVELDEERRYELFHELQARIYEQQPYMFTYNVPVKFAMNKRIRNFKSYAINPGYSVRDWFIEETEQ